VDALKAAVYATVTKLSLMQRTMQILLMAFPFQMLLWGFHAGFSIDNRDYHVTHALAVVDSFFASRLGTVSVGLMTTFG
jgi:hypothetical protein